MTYNEQAIQIIEGVIGRIEALSEEASINNEKFQKEMNQFMKNYAAEHEDFIPAMKENLSEKDFSRFMEMIS